MYFQELNNVRGYWWASYKTKEHDIYTCRTIAANIDVPHSERER